ncbi:hypothetical protein F4V91_06755 [Neorhizobium galegae]|uniref:Uncharacterized protein n=1 Tax=Neorhizobium galegae TaxID=399 RepID=A0A6A1TP39_NEOGA|nr:hypothetical protein [Neorhizobium galegae]KAB1086158.1 hypothetical protein F4V91_06755 [Neorhizobium galegae]
MVGERVLFYLWSGQRSRIIEELKFYVDEADNRLLSRFDAMSEEAEAHAREVYESMGRFYDPERHDPGDFAESAHDSGIRYYGLLDDLRKRTILSVLAGMYVEYEKQLREFLVDELEKSLRIDKLKPKLWRQEISKIYDFLDACGWSIRTQPSFANLDACRLIVNVYKHGAGPSFDELKDKYPEYLRSVFPREEQEDFLKYADHNDLTVTREDIGIFHQAFKAFWEAVPENTYFSQAENVPEWVVKALQPTPP